MGLLSFLFGRGRKEEDRDGSSPKKAIVVGSIAEEYQWMQRRLPGYRPREQALLEVEGKPYDILTWENAHGETRTVYFDISSFVGQ